MIRYVISILIVVLMIFSAGAVCASQNSGFNTNINTLGLDHAIGVNGPVLTNMTNMTNSTNSTNATQGIGLAPLDLNGTQVQNNNTNILKAAGSDNTHSVVQGPGIGLQKVAQKVDNNATQKTTLNATKKVANNATQKTTQKATQKVTQKATQNSTQKATQNASIHKTANAKSSQNSLEKQSTGNPILALFAVSAVLGSYAYLRKD